jgi:DNA-binding HxlR family transcriptional regulator
MIARTREALALLEAKRSVNIIFLLASGVRGHARLVDNIPGLSKKVLTATLRKLEQNGIVSRQVYADMPVRVEYTLTPLGWQLTEPLMALLPLRSRIIRCQPERRFGNHNGCVVYSANRMGQRRVNNVTPARPKTLELI